jgi:formate hydrogenlyase subunit 6/NADH:ubiquinone oxidoreductase subunit I
VSICSSTGACLQPAVSEAGLEGLWTPVAMMRQGYCEFNCRLCGQVCPSGAIKELTLEIKQKTKMGIAYFDKNRCLPYYKSEDCLVCEEHCPTPDKAIKFLPTLVEKNGSKKMVKIPEIVEQLCIGCGICEYKCPIVGRAGVYVVKVKEQTL